MKSPIWIALLFPFALFASDKEPSLRIETLHPDGTKTVKEMVTPSKLEKERIAKAKVAAEKNLKFQLQRENVARMAAKSPQTVLSEKQRYLALIVTKIQRYWFVDDSMRGKECRVNMTLAPDGALTSVTVLGGHRYLCFFAVDAINNGSPYPMSSNPDIYDALKDITIILQPELR